ncbi:hypothetical protein [Actinomadura sp. 7K534]|uniref:hypothetical protein n=1 Tax=Actinomadura sp. 7K534 TaxID=2530366 RepID=UPI001052A0B1|nr:hypothetical protein [Actinomadura sp. 7K534]TDB95619.1 hypothetical protein E1266_12490 [Actinomadura sp. 7K534]
MTDAPGRGPTPYDPQRYDELTKGVATLLAQAAPAGWKRIDMKALMTVGVSDVALTVVLRDGTSPQMELPRDVIGMLGELRSMMYRPGEGTWLSMRLMMDPPGTYYTSFNNDYDPLWEPELTAGEWSADLAAFPRDDEHVPGWLRDRLQEAR